MKKITSTGLKISLLTAAAVGLTYLGTQTNYLAASSHREAPMIANDPLADNTDLYAFRNPNDPSMVTIIANYIPLQLPQGGPNFASFGENIRYEIHVNNKGQMKDDIIYRFTFAKQNEDPTTFFNIRLGKQNLKTTYTAQKSVDGGATFTDIVTNGIVPPPNVGPRSIEGAAGLGTTYDALVNSAIMSASTGEKVYCGPADDPFFADLGGIFDLGQTRNNAGPRDGLGGKNIHSIALNIPISMLSKNGLGADAAANILDENYIIGVWASASRPKTRTLGTNGTLTDAGAWVQISRIGMPLTNEAIIPIGAKDRWNARTPYTEDTANDKYFGNPELALYMDDSKFGGAVPALAPLRVQANSLQKYDFRNGKDGLSGLASGNAAAGTALANDAFGPYLLRKGQPRSVDLLPIFHTGVPNLPPYQLATGKPDGNPLAAGKPFINNFLPIKGDMLRLNMAVPPTPRNTAAFSNMGLLAAAVTGLTDAKYNNKNIENIPNMDGFPNGRRLEDDVVTIELKAVGGVVLAAIGLWYDDYTPMSTPSPVTPKLQSTLGYSAGVENNDVPFKPAFPFVQNPLGGYENHTGQ